MENQGQIMIDAEKEVVIKVKGVEAMTIIQGLAKLTIEHAGSLHSVVQKQILDQAQVEDKPTPKELLANKG